MLSYGRFSYDPFLCSMFDDLQPKIGVYATTFSFYLLRTTENGRFFSEFEISKTLFQKPLNRRVLATPLGSFANAKARAGVPIIAAFTIAITLAILAAIATTYAFERISDVFAD